MIKRILTVVWGFEGLAYGVNKGYSGVTLRDPKARVSRRKGALSKKTAFVREIVKEVAGYISHFVLLHSSGRTPTFSGI